MTNHEPYPLYPDLLCVPLRNDRSTQAGYSEQGWVITGADGKSLLGVDVAQEDGFEALQKLCSIGDKTLKGMLITHRHILGGAKNPDVLGQQVRFRRYAREHDVPVFLHRSDAALLATQVEPQLPEDLRLTFTEPAGHQYWLPLTSAW